jgi:hypothetical protein
MKLGTIVDINKILSEATVKELTTDERLSVVKALKATRIHAKEYDDFVSDLRDKFSTPNLESITRKIQMGKDMTEAEVNEFLEYNVPVSKAIAEERERDIEIDLPKFEEGTIAKMLGENGWKGKVFELFDY